MIRNNLLYLLLLIIFDGFCPIPPTNSEFWLSKYMYNNSVGSRLYNFIYYYFVYIIASLIGGFIGYSLGFYYQQSILSFLEFVHRLMFSDNSITIKNSLSTYDPLKILLLKSFTPGLPVSIFNVLCGINGSKIINFIAVTCAFRSCRFSFLFLLKRYLQYTIIGHVIYIITAIYAFSSIILLVYASYLLKIENIFVF